MAKPALSRRHMTRLRQIYRSSGWPTRDLIEVDLLVAGLLESHFDSQGHETLRVTPKGLTALSDAHALNKFSRSAHDELVMRVARQMQQGNRIVWTGLPLRAQVEEQWVRAVPDVYSVRNTSVENYLFPMVHEIKVSRADLLSDLKKPEKRAAYLELGSQVFYVLGNNAKGKPIADPDEVPEECGVMLVSESGVYVARGAPIQRFRPQRFDLWIAMAKASPVPREDDGRQLML